MGMRMPETCWAVFKRQTINMRNCCIWLVDSFESLEKSVRYQPNDTASHPTRLQSSTISLWEPQNPKMDCVKLRTANVTLICPFLTSTELLPQLLCSLPRLSILDHSVCFLHHPLLFPDKRCDISAATITVLTFT